MAMASYQLTTVMNNSSSPSENNATKKICLVCGDRALGYNFNAITCESCKAFFRRNALKQKVFKCPFRDNCDITILSRRFCQKCRLRKCLHVGMLSELIMATRNGDQNGDGVKIRKRRRHRHSAHQFMNETSPYELPNRIIYDLSENNSISPDAELKSTVQHADSDTNKAVPNVDLSYNYEYQTNPKIDVDQWNHFAQFYNHDHSPLIERYEYGYVKKESRDTCEYKYPVKKESTFDQSIVTVKAEQQTCCYFNLDTRKLDVFSPSDLETRKNRYVSQYSNGSDSNRSANSTDDSIAVSTGELSQDDGSNDEWPVVVADFSSGLSTWKLCLLEELLSANEIMAIPNNGPPVAFADYRLAEHMGEVCVRKCAQVARRIQAFRDLTMHDQIILLKESSTETMFLRGLMVFQNGLDCWRPVGYPHRYLPLTCSLNYRRLKKFYMNFPDSWRHNDPIMLCLSAIVLFDPTRIGLRDVESVRWQQKFYCDLLKEYLTSVFPDEAELYWRIGRMLNIMRKNITTMQPLLSVTFDNQNAEILSVEYDWRRCTGDDTDVSIYQLEN